MYGRAGRKEIYMLVLHKTRYVLARLNAHQFAGGFDEPGRVEDCREVLRWDRSPVGPGVYPVERGLVTAVESAARAQHARDQRCACRAVGICRSIARSRDVELQQAV